jgi:predicted enzyme related to lactoylglutathione lyase
MIKNMSLAWISVSDFERAKKFYVDTLGLRPTAMAPEYGWMELMGEEGGHTLGVGVYSADNGPEKAQPVKPGQNAVMTFGVDDLHAARALLAAKGVKFVGDVIEIPDHVRMLFFQDPDGNYFQLVQTLD